MRIASIIDISLVDVPGIPVTVIFTGGCNFDCPYCQNAEIIPLNSGTEMSIEEIVLKSSGNLVDGFCITGGEPTIHRDLPDMLRALKSTGLHVNLNTQGSVPLVLEKCLPYLDSVWFDIKAQPEAYSRVSRTVTNPWKQIVESTKLLIDSDVAFWPRTTFTGSLLSTADIVEIGQVLDDLGFHGSYVIQNYVASAGVRESERAKLSIPDISEVESVKDKMPSGIKVRFDWR
ncbi:MAG: anaerobic ribonucleoside-triphosphate reductase activating protein [Candidatus Thorarchaeota archaeon]|jgi:pyruvate formate lyase activating enzyme